MERKYDVVIVGAGPNGLSAAIELARSNLSVLVLEAAPTAGGGARTQALTLPGFLHDVCSAVHPLGVASPFFRSLGLERYGLSWVHPSAPLAHVLDEDRVIMLERSVEATAKQFATDAAAYSDLVSPFVEGFDQLLPMILAPLSLPSHPLLMARFGGVALRSMTGLARSRFDGAEAAALLGAGSRLPPSYRARLERFRYGPGVFKIDWALSAPIPWRNPGCARAATVHLSGALPEMAKAQQLPSNGKFAERPFTLLVQPTLFDETRAPAAMHTAWAYCHVPAGSPLDATDAIEEQVERFAPGFRRQILAKSAKNALEMQRYNANYVGGDINGGMANLAQLFFRPAPRVDPYSTPATDIFLCSSSTPPGGGVHGMCGYWAARSVLKHAFQRAG